MTDRPDTSAIGSVEEAHRALNDAALLRDDAERRPGLCDPDPDTTLSEAAELEAEALAFLFSDDDAVGEARELVPRSESSKSPPRRSIRVAAIADNERLSLAREARSVELSIDMAESLEAANSAELAFTYQMAATHALSQRLLGLANVEIMRMRGLDRQQRREAMVEIARISNAAARLMDTYQRGMFVLAKVRSGGRQTVVVQHVQVNDGGQALVAGQLRDKDKGDRGEE